MKKKHIFIAVYLDEIDDVIDQLKMAKEVASKAYILDKRNGNEDGEDDYEPSVKITIESREYSDDFDVTIKY